MKGRHLLAVCTAAVMLSTGVAACGDSSDSSGSTTASRRAATVAASQPVGETRGPNGEKPTPSSELSLTESEVAEVRRGDYTAAMVWHGGSEFTSAVTNGARDRFDELGMRVVATTEADFDIGKQKSDVETVMAKRPSVMLTLPVDAAASRSTYESVADAGARLVFLSNVPPGMAQGRDYVTVATDDLFQMGKQAADALAAAIGGEGEIAYFFHDATYYVTNQRDEAFKQTIEQSYPDIEIVAEQGIADVNRAEEQANSVLVQNPDIDGIYATFSTTPGEGVLSALRNNGNGDARLVSLDLSEPLALDMVNDGNVAALVTDQAYELGRAMATASAYGLLGRRAPPFVVVPATTVTKENLEEGYQESLHTSPPSSVMDAAK